MTLGAAPVVRLPLLDGLRGIAAIAVMLYHAGNVFQVHTPFYRSYLFVDIFFILSGFVLTLAAEPRLRQGQPARVFIVRRVRRLWPMIVVGALFGAIATGLTQGWKDVAVLLVMAALVMPSFWHSWLVFPLNGSQWSLLHELVANVAHAVFLRRLGERGLLAVIALSAAANAWTIWYTDCNCVGPVTYTFQLSFPRVIFSYTLGIWFARRWSQRAWRPTVSWQMCLFSPVVLAMALAYVAFPKGAGDALFAFVVFPVLFWLAATADVPARAVPALMRLGAISFPLYAVHLPILTLFGSIGHGWPVAISAIATSLAVAQVLALTMESRLSGTPRPAARPIAAAA